MEGPPDRQVLPSVRPMRRGDHLRNRCKVQAVRWVHPLMRPVDRQVSLLGPNRFT